jgi:hypothetical protein
MNKQQTNFPTIPDTSFSSEYFILPETHKRYSRLIAQALRRQLKTHQDWEILSRSLITICWYADYGRHIQVLREVSDFLLSLPIRKESLAIGAYYRAGTVSQVERNES